MRLRGDNMSYLKLGILQTSCTIILKVVSKFNRVLPMNMASLVVSSVPTALSKTQRIRLCMAKTTSRLAISAWLIYIEPEPLSDQKN